MLFLPRKAGWICLLNVRTSPLQDIEEERRRGENEPDETKTKGSDVK